MRYKAGYWYQNETLIERLDITEVEQQHLKTIIGVSEKYNRNNERRKKARRNENGLTKKQQELEDLKLKIKQLNEKGLNNSQIAKNLGVNRTKVIRLLKEFQGVQKMALYKYVGAYKSTFFYGGLFRDMYYILVNKFNSVG